MVVRIYTRLFASKLQATRASGLARRMPLDHQLENVRRGIRVCKPAESKLTGDILGQVWNYIRYASHGFGQVNRSRVERERCISLQFGKCGLDISVVAILDHQYILKAQPYSMPFSTTAISAIGG